MDARPFDYTAAHQARAVSPRDHTGACGVSNYRPAVMVVVALLYSRVYAPEDLLTRCHASAWGEERLMPPRVIIKCRCGDNR